MRFSAVVLRGLGCSLLGSEQGPRRSAGSYCRVLTAFLFTDTANESPNVRIGWSYCTNQAIFLSNIQEAQSIVNAED